MIKYEDILKIIDPIFVSTVNIITWDKFNEFVDTLNKKNCIHIHTKWAIDFYRSEYFSKNNILKNQAGTIVSQHYQGK